MILDGYVCSVVKDMDFSQIVKHVIDVDILEHQSISSRKRHEKHKTPTRERPE